MLLSLLQDVGGNPVVGNNWAARDSLGGGGCCECCLPWKDEVEWVKIVIFMR